MLKQHQYLMQYVNYISECYDLQRKNGADKHQGRVIMANYASALPLDCCLCIMDTGSRELFLHFSMTNCDARKSEASVFLPETLVHRSSFLCPNVNMGQRKSSIKERRNTHLIVF